VNLILSPQSLNEYKDQAKTNQLLFTHLLTCLAENFNIFRREEAAVFIILSLSHSCSNQDQQNFDAWQRKFRIGCRYALILQEILNLDREI
jgi:cytoplasmic iron level regulating protein YaaA (DUF328/UPF0246 family)